MRVEGALEGGVCDVWAAVCWGTEQFQVFEVLLVVVLECL